MTARRFPPPWSIEERPACYIVKDSSGQALAYVYFEDEPGRQSAAKRNLTFPEFDLPRRNERQIFYRRATLE